MGDQLSGALSLSPVVLVFLICLFTAMVTEVGGAQLLGWAFLNTSALQFHGQCSPLYISGAGRYFRFGANISQGPPSAVRAPPQNVTAGEIDCDSLRSAKGISAATDKKARASL